MTCRRSLMHTGHFWTVCIARIIAYRKPKKRYQISKKLMYRNLYRGISRPRRSRPRFKDKPQAKKVRKSFMCIMCSMWYVIRIMLQSAIPCVMNDSYVICMMIWDIRITRQTLHNVMLSVWLMLCHANEKHVMNVMTSICKVCESWYMILIYDTCCIRLKKDGNMAPYQSTWNRFMKGVSGPSVWRSKSRWNTSVNPLYPIRVYIYIYVCIWAGRWTKWLAK